MTKRRKLPPRDFGTLWNRQQGTCGCGCGESLDSGPVDVEHQLPVALGGSNDLENLSLWLRPCHKIKTRDDVKRIRKADRQRRYHETGKSHQHRTRPIQSRGFDKTLKRKMNGEVVKTWP